MSVSIAENITYAIQNFANEMILDSNYQSPNYHRTDVCAAHLSSAAGAIQNQKWTLVSTGTSGEYYIKNVWDNFCIDLTGTSTGSGITGTTCQNKDSQKWTITLINTVTTGVDPKFCILNKASTLVAGATTGSTNGYNRCGVPVQGATNSCSSNAAQQWMFFPVA